MTRDEILAMEAGGELDEIVATRMMGWQRQDETPEGRCCPKNGHDWISPDGERWRCHACGWSFPSYSTEIAPAWEVVEKLWTERWIWFKIHPSSDEGWQVNIEINNRSVPVIADTAPLAICRAALLAIMEVDE